MRVAFPADLALGLLFATTAGAQSPGVVIRATNASGDLGETVELSIVLDNLSSASVPGWSFCFDYDTTLLELVAVELGSAAAALAPELVSEAPWPARMRVRSRRLLIRSPEVPNREDHGIAPSTRDSFRYPSGCSSPWGSFSS